VHGMALTEIEQRFLDRQPRVHLATIGSDGEPQVKPVGFTYNSSLGTIDITGFNMADSAKYRNVQRNPKVALVADEVTEPSMEGAHFLEIRGRAEVTTEPAVADGHLAAEIIRVRPRRVISFNIDPSNMGFEARNIADPDAPTAVA
jgi:pyridoxamine 5'-phosphate oxidase family protein